MRPINRKYNWANQASSGNLNFIMPPTKNILKQHYPANKVVLIDLLASSPAVVSMD